MKKPMPAKILPKILYAMMVFFATERKFAIFMQVAFQAPHLIVVMELNAQLIPATRRWIYVKTPLKILYA